MLWKRGSSAPASYEDKPSFGEQLERNRYGMALGSSEDHGLDIGQETTSGFGGFSMLRRFADRLAPRTATSPPISSREDLDGIDHDAVTGTLDAFTNTLFKGLSNTGGDSQSTTPVGSRRSYPDDVRGSPNGSRFAM